MNVVQTAYTTEWFSGLLSSYHWQGPLAFSIPSGTASYTQNYSPETEWNNWYELTPEQKNSYRSMIEQINNLTLLDIKEVADSYTYGDLRVAYTDIPSQETLGYAYLPGPKYVEGKEASEAAGDIWLNSDLQPDPPTPGSWMHHTMMHELGHALGLSHPFEEKDNFPASPSSYDNYQFTLMSYTDHPSMPGVLPTTFQLMDVAALQYLYGANQAFNSTDTYYEFGPNIPMQTLWDGGGTDTLDFSAVNTPVSGSLMPGNFISAGVSTNLQSSPVTGEQNLAIAFGTEIEHFIGSDSGNDIQGNNLNNRVMMGTGIDTYFWSSGNDSIQFGEGQDTAVLTGNSNLWSLNTAQGIDLNQLSLTTAQASDLFLLELQNVEYIQFSNETLSPAQFMFSLEGDAELNSDTSVWNSDLLTETGNTISAADAQLARLYLGALGRTPDSAGFEWWRSAADGDGFLEEAAAGFYFSDEFQSKSDVNNDQNVSPDELLNQLYKNVLGREPDASGYDWWLNQLYLGDYLPQEVVLGFTQSDEYVYATLQVIGLQTWLS